ncbi:hypothetical protein HPB48_020118 [Haemaphysalis longicornis]|uniref:SOSS complex subunit B1 n=1 Tax=Haemaphysalis longicornis TaxID=44386 RepID=A0A9J6FB27_HAELO|nr:hypothetical protein HPB48_020118 [Haemaphysalis longicornis]
MEWTAIRDLKPGMRNLNLTFIVLEIQRFRTTRDGREVRTFKVADRSGSILFCQWDESGAYLEPGDICEVSKGYASLWRGRLLLYTGKHGAMKKVGDFCLEFSETPFMSEPIPELEQQQSKLNATVADRRSPSPHAASRANPPQPPIGSPGALGSLSRSGGAGRPLYRNPTVMPPASRP